MPKTDPRILVISSVSPSKGPAIIGAQIYEALRQKGLEVDFLTRFPEPGHPEYLWAERNNIFNRWCHKIADAVRWILAIGHRYREKGYCMFYTTENKPPVPVRKVMRAIRKEYDLVYIIFWHGMLSFDTVEHIYDRLHCQIHFRAADYSPMAGGCHFTLDCDGYQKGCGRCPAIGSMKEHDITWQNVLERRRIYDKVKPVVTGNLYMMEYYRRSLLLKDARTVLSDAPIIDTDVFRPVDSAPLRARYGIPDSKKKIILFGCQAIAEERKGMSYLLEAFDKLYGRMGADAANVLVMAVGNQYDDIKDRIAFDSIGTGYVSMNELPGLYSLATLFVCPSVNDAGPMMVNQSLCCGTPVVGFDMGAVRQVVKDRGTGRCAPLKDTDALADGMLDIIRMSEQDYSATSARAREVALSTSSFSAQADKILKVYEEYSLNR